MVIDLCGMDGADADALIDAIAACARPPSRLILASSLAERLPQAWRTHPASHAALDAEALPEDTHGIGKRDLRHRCHAALSPVGIEVWALLLPQLHDPTDSQGRETAYIAEARAAGVVRLPGGGGHRPCVAHVESAAAAIAAIASGAIAPPGRPLQLAPPLQPTLAALVRALLDAAGFAEVPLLAGEPRGRGPHAGGDEVVDGAPLRALLPGLPWPALAAAHPAASRPPA